MQTLIRILMVPVVIGVLFTLKLAGWAKPPL